MSDIKTEPDVSVCCGCLSTDRTLSLTNEDLYWSFIKEEHQDKLLISPYLCWECTATARRLQRFQTQVQKAYSVLRDCLVHSLDFDQTDPKYNNLSTLNVHHNRKFDSTFIHIMTDVKVILTRMKMPVVNVNSKKENNEHTHFKVMKNEPSSDFSDDDSFNRDDNKTNISPKINDHNVFRDPKLKNSITIEIPKDIGIIKEKNKPESQHIYRVSKPETENLLKKLNNANIFVKKVCIQNIGSKNKIVKASFVKTPSLRDVEIKLKQFINAQQNMKIDKNEKSQKIKIAQSQLEIEYSTDDDMSDIKSDDSNFEDENVKLNVSGVKLKEPKKLSDKSRIKEIAKKKTNTDNKLEHSDDEDGFMDTAFDDDADSDYVEDKYTKTNATVNSIKRKQCSERNIHGDIHVENDDYFADMQSKSTISIEPLSFHKTPALIKVELQLKKFIQETPFLARRRKKVHNNSGKNGNNEDSNPNVKKARTMSDSDPDFCPTGDEDEEEKKEASKREKKLNDAPKKGSDKIKVKKYTRLIARYSTIEEVARHFTEVEMSEQEFNTILEKEDAFVYEKKPHRCFVCGKFYEKAKNLYDHGRCSHKLRYGDMVAKKTPENLKVPGSQQKPCLWRCHECSRYLRKQHAVEHVNEHHRAHLVCNGEGCQWSPKIYLTKDDFLDHWERIHKNYVCDICDKRHTTRSAMVWHMNEEHLRVPTLQCPHCPKKYYRRHAMYTHVALTHPKPEPVESRYCVECDVTFKSSRHYVMHVHGKHKAKKDWPCPECPVVFKTSRSYSNHLDVVHRGIKFQCDKCGKYMSSKKSLGRHLLLHLNLKRKAPYKLPCPMCGRLFQTNIILNNHILTHTGERPHKCDLCPAAYTQKHCLKTHLAKAHDIHIVPKLTRPPATVQSVPHAPVAVRNVPGASVTVQNVLQPPAAVQPPEFEFEVTL